MRVHLIQPSSEHAEALAAEFAEFDDEVFVVGDGAPPPGDVCIICLDPEPDRALRLLAATAAAVARDLPLLFVGGDERALLRAHELHPLASFTRQRELHSAVASLRS